jgi:hypothetical protein
MDRRKSLGRIHARVICFNPQTEHIGQILSTLPAARVTPAVRATKEHLRRLSAYGKFLMYDCRSRHSHAHYHYASALGVVIASMQVWRDCVDLDQPMLVLEENAALVNIDELRECAQRFDECDLDLLMLHQHQFLPDTCSGDAAARDGKRLARTSHGGLFALMWPSLSAKGYLISPALAAHLLRVNDSRIDNLHVDSMLGMETLRPSNRVAPFRGAIYRARASPIITVVGKSYKGITHESVSNNGGILHFLQRVLNLFAMR